MKIPEYGKVATLADSDLFIVETENGTKTITGENLKSETKTDISGKVDKETGKGLSTNDFDNATKIKVDGIEDLSSSDVTDIKNSFNLI